MMKTFNQYDVIEKCILQLPDPTHIATKRFHRMAELFKINLDLINVCVSVFPSIFLAL